MTIESRDMNPRSMSALCPFYNEIVANDIIQNRSIPSKIKVQSSKWGLSPMHSGHAYRCPDILFSNSRSVQRLIAPVRYRFTDFPASQYVFDGPKAWLHPTTPLRIHQIPGPNCLPVPVLGEDIWHFSISAFNLTVTAY